jgi:hypothetical protein
MSEEKPDIFGCMASMAGTFVGFGFVGWLLGSFVGCFVRVQHLQAFDAKSNLAPFSAYTHEGVVVGIIAGTVAALFPLGRLFGKLEAASEKRRAVEHQRQLEEDARVQRAKDAEEARLREAEQARKAAEEAKIREAEQARKAAEEARIAAEKTRKVEEIARIERLRRERQECQENTLDAVNTSLCLFESMTKNFEDRAFAPFWDSIEKATKQLAHFDDNLKNFKFESSRYTQLVTRFEGVPPEFSVSPQSVARLEVARETAKHMKATVRKAQCDFQFATIYEQRKTNKILIAGFTNFAQALEGMGDRISASIDSLSGLVSDLSESICDIHERMGEMAESAMQHDSNLGESLSAIHTRMGEMAETAIEHNEEMRRTATESADRERKALELLEAVEREYRA